MVFLLGTQSSHPKGDPALLWNSLNLPVDQAPNSSIYISVIHPLCHERRSGSARIHTWPACSAYILKLAFHQTGKCRVFLFALLPSLSKTFKFKIYMKAQIWKMLTAIWKTTTENNLKITQGFLWTPGSRYGSSNNWMSIGWCVTGKMKGSQTCRRNKWAEAFHDSYRGFILALSEASDPKCWIGLCISLDSL